jgi:hypothetical protein
MINITVAVAGKVVPGPAGKAGTITMPIRIVALQDNKVAYSQLQKHQVQITDTSTATQFSFNDPNLSLPDTGKKESKLPPAALPAALATWVASELKIEVGARQAEWSPEEIYLSLPRPGGDAWLRIARDTGELEYERTDRGWVSYLNDLHKGRNTGVAWSWFIDLFALACLVFSITGLFILKMHAANRPTTWPIVALGLVLPLLLAILFIH